MPKKPTKIKPGDKLPIVGTVQQCAGCSELRIHEIPCLACDLPAAFVEQANLNGYLTCNCFDWPE